MHAQWAWQFIETNRYYGDEIIVWRKQLPSHCKAFFRLTVTSLENLVVFVGDLWISLRPRRFLRTKLLILSWYSTLKVNTHTLSLRRLRSPLNFLYSLAYICHHFTSEYLKLNQTILPVVYDFLLTTFPLNNLMIFCKRISLVASRSSNKRLCRCFPSVTIWV